MEGLRSVTTVEVANALIPLLSGQQTRIELGGATVTMDRNALVFGAPPMRFALPSKIRLNLTRRNPANPLRPDAAAKLDDILRRCVAN